MLDTLINRQNGDVAGSGQPPMVEQPLQVAEHAIVPVGDSKQAIHHVRTRKVQARFGNLRRVVV
jgi:hypothetical protein